MINLVTEIRGRSVTSSRKVAETFGKEHYNVLRDIESLDCSTKFTALNLEVSTYKDKSEKKMINEYKKLDEAFNDLRVKVDYIARCCEWQNNVIEELFKGGR